MSTAQDNTTLPKDDFSQENDVEKALSSDTSSEEGVAPYVEQRQVVEAKDVTSFRGKLAALTIRLGQYGVETRGVVPTPPDARNDTRFWNLLFLWISANFNILAFSTGSLGPAIFALGLKESLLVIFFINLLSATLPAYFSTFGPRLGMRQMIVSRYSFGFYGSIIPSLLNLITFMGFLILNLILGGETLAAVSGYQAGHGGLSWDVGIAIVGVIALLASYVLRLQGSIHIRTLCLDPDRHGLPRRARMRRKPTHEPAPGRSGIVGDSLVLRGLDRRVHDLMGDPRLGLYDLPRRIGLDP
ncbi:permease, cytosine/purine, uracil, thiamine, allantoin family protein [Rhizoctonia solani AG-3 Rhs1AP]|uniref:Permease, cytosine/purine, uracil, thiamine, allantoin family protein n=1 Tax=Rhizoctonia solani AG-3 Rhs1AP TaxID=1086054 RepID=X8J6W7_9AGAM|nr:permease, cytosine/purine, uracil, thiamine, allantoin family protein [Rhizoctonia solani AG-3 Rhs1AP]